MGFVIFSEPDVAVQLREVLKQFRDKWSRRFLSLSGFFSKLAVAGTLIRLYRKYGDDPEFRNAMEAFYIKLIESKGLNPQQIGEIIGIKFMPKDVQEMIMEDLEESVETLRAREFLKENKEKVYRFLSQASWGEC